MWGIATRHGLTLSKLAALNPRVKRLELLHAGQKLNLVARSPGATADAPRAADRPQPPRAGRDAAARGGPPAPLRAGMPQTEGLSAAQRYRIYAAYVKEHGDAQARRDLAAGRRVVLSLRRDTPMNGSTPYTGRYDDRMVVLWRDRDGAHAKEFAANTEPNRQWSIPANNSSKPVGRLADGQTVRYARSWSSKFGAHLVPLGRPAAQRDRDRNYRFSRDERAYTGAWGGQSMFIHRGFAGNTASQGCQTIEQSRFDDFLRALGGQREVSDVLLNVTRR